MARNATTGELVWAYNIVPQDAWDLDQPLITPLIDVTVNGVAKKAAVKFSRLGYMYLWDRATGELLNQPWMAEYTDLVTAKGIDMTTGRPSYNIDTMMFTNVEDRRKYTQADPRGGANKPANYTGTEVEYCPGTAARNWENDAWNPKLGILYTHSDTTCAAQIVVTGEYKPGEGYTLRQTAGGAAAPNKDLDGKVTTIGSRLQANDPVARKNVWMVPYNDTGRVAVMATATDLVFHGNQAEGTFQAYDGKTGKVLWSFRAGARWGQSPISYSFGGKQYIAIIASSAAANTAVAANAAPDNANRYRRSGTTLYVFKLPG